MLANMPGTVARRQKTSISSGTQKVAAAARAAEDDDRLQVIDRPDIGQDGDRPHQDHHDGRQALQARPDEAAGRTNR